MREKDIGDVVVLSPGKVAGIVTDRDPSDTAHDAVRVMRDNAIRRLKSALADISRAPANA